MLQSIKIGSRLCALAACLLAAAASGCADDASTRSESSTICCECGCSTGDGTPCLSITVETDDVASCPVLCEARCEAQPECPSMFESTSCEPDPEGEPWRPNGKTDTCVDDCTDPEDDDSPPPPL